MTTLAGWVPWLADTLDAGYGTEAFHTFVRQDSVLLLPGEDGVNAVGRWLPWLPTERSRQRTARRLCPICATEPDRGTPLTATVPLMLSCPEHGCRLEAEADITRAAVWDEAAPHRPAPEYILNLDRLTAQGMTSGAVALARRAVHVGVWFRMLRTLLDEVAISTSRVRRRSAAALEQIWRTVEWPARAGLSVWQPYESLDTTRQEAMLEAASCAAHLIRDGQITAYGTLGHLLTRQSDQHVYAGDRLSAADEARATVRDMLRDSWELARQDVEDWFQSARTDPAPLARSWASSPTTPAAGRRTTGNATS